MLSLHPRGDMRIWIFGRFLKLRLFEILVSYHSIVWVRRGICTLVIKIAINVSLVSVNGAHKTPSYNPRITNDLNLSCLKITE